MSGHLDVAQAIRTSANKAARRAVNVQLAEVVSTSPLVLDFFTMAMTLSEDDLELSGWADFYRGEYGVEAGDTALVVVEQGEYMVFDFKPLHPPQLKDTKSIKSLVANSATKSDVMALQSEIDVLLVGGSDKSFLFSQVSPSATWTIHHNFGRHPAGIRAYDLFGNEMVDFGISHTNLNTTVLTFSLAERGSADLS